MAKIPAKVASKAKQISVLLMDVDGTLTDGSVTLASTPDNHALEVKTFDAHDGQGLTLAVTAGLRTGVITGRSSAALRRRCKELDIEFVYEKQGHKIAAYEDVLRKTGAKESEVAFLGDDLPDLTIMRRVGLAVAVANAAPEVRRAADYRTKAVGGKGGGSVGDRAIGRGIDSLYVPAQDGARDQRIGAVLVHCTRPRRALV